MLMESMDIISQIYIPQIEVKKKKKKGKKQKKKCILTLKMNMFWKEEN